MPREGIFAEVLTGGMIRVGDCVEVVMPQEDRPYSVAVITLSDKAFAGERDDLSGPAIEKILKDSEEKDHIRFDIKETILLPDGEEGLKKQLIRLADQRQVDLILTTGGTGFAPRDMTPEATIAVCDRMANGIADDMKLHIFEMFYTGKNTVADSRRSFGIGLTLCKSIVELHGGTLTLTDNVPHGCIFTFTLPLSEVTLNE